jgi:acyl carrier protein
MSEHEIQELIREAIRFAEPELAAVELTPGSTLSELGIGSVSALEMVGYIEDRLGIQIPDDQLAGLSSLDGLVRLIRSHAPNVPSKN